MIVAEPVQPGPPYADTMAVPLVDGSLADCTIVDALPCGVVLVFAIIDPAEVGVPEPFKVMSWQPVAVKVPEPLKVTPLLAVVLIFHEPTCVTLA